MLMAKKNYVLDTNIFLHNPDALKLFEDNNVYIPHPVIEELDKFKKERNERGWCAREALRQIGELRELGNLKTGVKNEYGGMIYLLLYEDYATKLPPGWLMNKPDNLILLDAKELALTSRLKTILVTNDTNMLLKADVMSIKAEELKNDRVSNDYEIYSGKSVRYIDDTLISQYSKAGFIEVPDSDAFMNITEGEFVNLRSYTGSSMLGMYEDGKIHQLYQSQDTPHPYGLSSRNVSQRFLQEALLMPYTQKPLVLINGPAGTGKTLYALACGLEQVTEMHLYQRVLVCRANVTMDEDLGFLPGTEREKIDPLLGGIYDNLETIFEMDKEVQKKSDTEYINEKVYMDLFEKGIIQARALAYLRGRSIRNTYIIIDEAQNCTPHQILSIITRAGDGSKVVCCGDVNQIDHPRLDTRNNGLIYAIERMSGSKTTAVCSFSEDEAERSVLAKEAAERLQKYNVNKSIMVNTTGK